MSLLTVLLFVGGLGVHGVQREARLSGNGEGSNAQGVHLLLPLAP